MQLNERLGLTEHYRYRTCDLLLCFVPHTNIVWLCRCPWLLLSWETSVCKMPPRTLSWSGSPLVIIPSDPLSPAPCSEVGLLVPPLRLQDGELICAVNYIREEINYTFTVYTETSLLNLGRCYKVPLEKQYKRSNISHVLTLLNPAYRFGARLISKLFSWLTILSINSIWPSQVTNVTSPDWSFCPTNCPQPKYIIYLHVVNMI